MLDIINGRCITLPKAPLSRCFISWYVRNLVIQDGLRRAKFGYFSPVTGAPKKLLNLHLLQKPRNFERVARAMC